MPQSGVDYREYPPHPQLAASVRAYWALEEQHTTETEQHLFLPERLVRLTFYAGESYVGRSGSDLEAMPPGYLLGLHSGPLRAVSRGLTKVLGVELYPWGALQLLSPKAGLKGAIVTELDAELTKLAGQVRGLLDLGALPEAIQTLEAWLLARQAARGREPGPAVVAATSLYRSAGAAKVADLAEAQGLSVRTLERQFLSEVGLSPKSLARLIRFEEAHNRLWLDPAQDLTHLALDLGFADQAHFTREFGAFARQSPGTFIRYIHRVREQRWSLQLA